VQVVRTLSQAVIALGTLAAASTYPAAAIDISGAGATFPYPIYGKWADAYKKETGVGLTTVDRFRRRDQANPGQDRGVGATTHRSPATN